MWFGNLVTMEWFDDVWLKEVFANLMAAKIVNPSFPEINHELNFLVRHAPRVFGRPHGRCEPDPPAAAEPQRGRSALRTDHLQQGADHDAPARIARGPGAYSGGASRVPGSLRVRECVVVGPDRHPRRDERRRSRRLERSLGQYAGRPLLQRHSEEASGGDAGHVLLQDDPAGSGRVWPQRFEIAIMADAAARRTAVLSSSRSTPLDGIAGESGERFVFNSDGRGYGLFPADAGNLLAWDTLGEVERAAELINLYENMLTGGEPAPSDYSLRCSASPSVKRTSCCSDSSSISSRRSTGSCSRPTHGWTQPGSSKPRSGNRCSNRRTRARERSASMRSPTLRPPGSVAQPARHLVG